MGRPMASAGAVRRRPCASRHGKAPREPEQEQYEANAAHRPPAPQPAAHDQPDCCDEKDEHGGPGYRVHGRLLQRRFLPDCGNDGSHSRTRWPGRPRARARAQLRCCPAYGSGHRAGRASHHPLERWPCRTPTPVAGICPGTAVPVPCGGRHPAAGASRLIGCRSGGRSRAGSRLQRSAGVGT